jgi:tetratricopeptide (TPR) repeat protein
MGMVYSNLGKQESALEHYAKCLEIKEQKKGKGSLDTASTLNNIGLVHKDLGKYELALQNCLKCL